MPGMSSSVRWGEFWVQVSGPGHSSAMRWAATMYGQSCRVVGRGGLGPLRFGGASSCWGRSLTFHSHRSVGISEVRWVHLARRYIAWPRSWLRLRMKSSVSRDVRSHVPHTYDFSSCFFPKFKKSAKSRFSRAMTYFFGFYGPKIGKGGFLLPGFCPKISKTLKFGLFCGIFACSGLVLQNSAAHQCTCL